MQDWMVDIAKLNDGVISYDRVGCILKFRERPLYVPRKLE
jgi:hypothetical protein